jgi:hypothetical protein
MAERVVVYSTASYPPHPSFLIYCVIGGALHYLKRTDVREDTALEIRLLPLTAVGATAFRVRQHLKAASGWFGRRAGPGSPAIPPDAFAWKATSARGAETLIGRRPVRISHVSPGSRSGRDYVRALMVARRLWHSCFSQKKFRGTVFLDLTYRGVTIGDLAASEYLRWARRGDGRLRPSPRLFFMLVDCVFICDTGFDRVQPSPRDAVFVLEPTYRHAAYQRTLRKRGLAVIDLKWWEETGFKVFKNADPFRLAFRIPPPANDLMPDALTRAERYLQGRIADPVAHLGYLDTGSNDNAACQVLGDDGQVLTLDPRQLHVTVFLHSFDDAQYLYGNDGFDDLVDWAVATIAACLANPRIATVLVKPHPTTWHGQFPNSRRGERWLKKRFSGESRVTWLDRRASLPALARTGKLVGITHHGSVAEELVYLNVPVIAYRYASWSEGYEFIRGWATPAEYLAMIGDLSDDSHEPVTEAERNSLLYYVHRGRLVPGRGHFDFIHDFRAWLRARNDPRAALDLGQLSSMLDRLTDEQAKRYMVFLDELATHD